MHGRIAQGKGEGFCPNGGGGGGGAASIALGGGDMSTLSRRGCLGWEALGGVSDPVWGGECYLHCSAGGELSRRGCLAWAALGGF